MMNMLNSADPLLTKKKAGKDGSLDKIKKTSVCTS